MVLRSIIAGLVWISSSSYAFEKCTQRTNCDNTTLGKLEYIWGQESNDKNRMLHSMEIIYSLWMVARLVGSLMEIVSF
ncbi:UNVERIFIED_ORG: hypothetical protein J2806_002400 [Kosakonia oryzae]|uniref:Uncharacterized protein n=1 Tax=Kosakonia radicincitans TaxID=283686 RepID=A0AAX2EXC0_9ENTR|nr:hypothetical protein [Kosakonia oryzae]SFE46620.1 hypothetical protein SAMN03159468_01848 [Kosakonia radicincitans]SFR23807.1 hypothetical protein SAMN03159514_04143 [Kosakonia radicincitans]SFU15263.1 hypothetical protein SAMN03159428_04754 [Kosakonia radicincitans]SFY29218.1 hypothetical protein SAMN03159436_04710 [Kosakonia radicincitans]